jgi:hypothetical protein
MTHSSRIEWCVLAAIAIAIAAFFFGVSYWTAGPVLLVLFLCAYPQSYSIAGNGLEVRDALTRRVIPYGAITRVAPLAGRVRIQHGIAAELIVSPVDGWAFMRDLAERTPHLTQRGPELVLRDRYVEYRVAEFGFIPG